jgi:hypothetical protein
VSAAFDIGMADLTVVTLWQDQGEYRTLIDEQAFQGVHLAEILARLRSRPYNITTWLGPHDLEVRDWSATGGPSGETLTRRQVAKRLGVDFVVVPRREHPEYHDAIRRLMASRLRIHRPTCPRTLAALGGYGRDWDGRLKVYKDRPRHDEHSHYIDSVKTHAVGYQPRDRKPPGWQPRPSKTIVLAGGELLGGPAPRPTPRPGGPVRRYRINNTL